ncbi:serine/threonine-protein phosphatase 7 long form-like protein [Senna tora]|uniref:Serine/threonine-protein phosphatase 7 long form-like protein n=1 Tax=Senna tora TaxID=362788 RepID=A0A834SNZ4_9FABA|nr:serine/threonine-protein phosphatase 7 long form-like protein [Senna tora]
MCEATRWDCENMGGCAHLLLAWAWDRFPILTPRLRGHKARKLSAKVEAARYPVPCPLSVRWSDYHTTTRELCTHNVTDYVLKMDNRSPTNVCLPFLEYTFALFYIFYTCEQVLIKSHWILQVVWQPYIGPELNGEIPSYCLHARDLGRAYVPLLCFHLLEWQQANRVMQQHGMRQGIPRPPANLDIQHTLKLTNKMHVHWPSRQLPWIQMWDQRWNRLVDTPKTTVPLASDAFPLHALVQGNHAQGKTYGVLTDQVYEQPLPANEIAHISRHMQTLNLHPDPEGAGNHEPTSAHILIRSGQWLRFFEVQAKEDERLASTGPHSHQASRRWQTCWSRGWRR